LSKKNFDAESSKDLMNMIDTGIKNVQLLTGGATENVSLAVLLQQANDTLTDVSTVDKV